MVLTGPGSRFGIWDFRFGFTLMRYVLYVGAVCLAASVVLLLIPKSRRAQSGALVVAAVLSAATVAPVLYQVKKARSLPFIHDITTDTNDPPVFVAIAPLRASAPTPVEYGGEEIASQQRKGYPALQPLSTATSFEAAFLAADQTAVSMGWEIIDVDAQEGRIEATDTTFWFGFKDDVVIRVRSTDDGSVVDVRSKSRVGGSDLGANAVRITKYLQALSERI